MTEKERKITYEVDDEGIAIVRLDTPNAEKNIISKEVLKRLYLVLTGIRDDKDVRGVILFSEKQNSFLEGYDVSELQALKNPRQAEKMANFGQHVVSALESLPQPTIAAINGNCNFAGLEIVLACDRRMCSFSKTTTLSMPQINLGLHAFLGGTQRLPHIVGVANALDLMLTGRDIYPDEAHKMNLIDSPVHPQDLLEEAKVKLRLLIENKTDSVLSKINISLGDFDFNGIFEQLKADGLAKQLFDSSIVGKLWAGYNYQTMFASQTREKYKAIPAIIKTVQKSFLVSRVKGLDYECRSFASLVIDRIPRNLIFLQKQKEEFTSQSQQTRNGLVKKTMSHGFLIGAGVKGGTLAALIASSGYKVRLKDTVPENITEGLKAARSFLEYKVRMGEIHPHEIDAHLALISPTLDYSGLKNAQFVIETLPEKFSIKQQVLSEISTIIKDETIIYTTTSILPFHQLAVSSGRPDRFVGLQFLPPIGRNRLVEVIHDVKTSGESLDVTLSFFESLKTYPFLIKDSPGYLINRILAPYLIESILLLEEGIKAEEIERIMHDFGMESGPLRIIDEIGIEQSLSTGQLLFFQFGERFRLPGSLKVLLNEKRLGRKSGHGFYRYNPDGSIGEIDPKINQLIRSHKTFYRRLSPPIIEQRLIFMLLNETTRCLDEGLIESTKHLDLAMIFAKLFPAFRGGPLRYIDTMGVQNIVREMDRFSSQFGDRFEPSSLLTEYATKNMKFYHNQ